MKRTVAAIVLGAVALTLTGCFPSIRPSAEREPEVSTPTAEALPEKCLTPVAGVVEKLQDDIAATMPGAEFLGHGVVKSESGDDFWYIAIEFRDPEQGRLTGTWGTMQDPTINGDIAYVAVDDMAPLVSTYKQPVVFQGTTSSLIGADDCIAD